MNIIDLFCGAGGFSAGFQKAGYKVVGAVDNWGAAVQTYKSNRLVKNTLLKDIRNTTKSDFPIKPDIIVGGPPCQGFSLAGRRNRTDPRNGLFKHFVRLVNDLEPKILLMENVQGILSMRTEKGELVMDRIRDEFDSIGYKVTYKTLNAANFGVPQLRNRVFIVANSLGLTNGTLFPKETYGLNSTTKHPYKTVKEAIMDISAMKDPSDEWNHKPMSHSSKVAERFSLIPQGIDLAKDQSFLPNRLKRKGYASNCKRLKLNEPSVTIVPGHYAFPVHPTRPRTLTVREIARLQTFYDTDIFHGTRDKQGILVGNGVPPVMAKAFANRFKEFAV
jgi:DNA (cytosine-5)-methyltransferase 1